MTGFAYAVDRIILRFGLSYRETPQKGLSFSARAGTLVGAFEQVAKDGLSELFRPYRPLTDAMADAPFVCLRLPTGGGFAG